MLDFFFDLFHTDVFTQNEGAKKLKAAIKSVPLANGIRTKAAFYYFKEMLYPTLHKKDLDGRECIAITRKEKEWQVAMFKESAMDFLQFLRNPDTENTLNSLKRHNNEKRWFDHIEMEQKMVFKWCKDPSLRNEAITSSQWYLQRYSIPFAIKLHFWEALSPKKRVLLFVIPLLFVAKNNLPFFYNHYDVKFWDISILVWVAVLAGVFSMTFVLDRLLLILWQIVQGRPVDVTITSLLSGIRLFLPKIILINFIIWWWVLHNYGQSDSLNDVLNIFDSLLSYFALFFIVSIVGLIIKTMRFPSMHTPKKLIVRATVLAFSTFVTSICIGIVVFTFMHSDINVADKICWSFSSKTFVAEMGGRQLYVFSLIAASLALIFELSANSIIEVLSP
jgi:hypothetical protein